MFVNSTRCQSFDAQESGHRILIQYKGNIISVNKPSVKENLNSPEWLNCIYFNFPPLL
jgi:hypothetical protein